VGDLIDKGLISMERSYWINEVGMKQNGNNVYTILPIEDAVGHYNEQQLRRLKVEAERQRAQARRSRLCAPPETPSTAGHPHDTPSNVKRCVGPVWPLCGTSGFGNMPNSRIKSGHLFRRPDGPHRPATRAGKRESQHIKVLN